MKVCFFIPSLDGGGGQRQCVAMVNALQHTPGMEVHLILLGPGVHDDSLDVSRLRLHRTVVGNFASPFALAFVVRTLRQVRPDLIISWLHPADIWSYAATRLVRGVPWVMTERNSVYSDRPGYEDNNVDIGLAYKIRTRIGRRAPAAIIANSEAGKQFWESQAPRSRVQMIPNMVIDNKIPSGAGADRSESDVCLFVGRLSPEKNVGVMTSAFTYFAATQPAARLAVAGKGSQAADMLRIAESAGVANRVEMLGFRKDVPQLMSRARVFLTLSRYEGMPNVVIEAIVGDLPAVVSDIPEHRALLGDDYPFYVRLSSSPQEMAGVIAQAWAHADAPAEQIYSHAREVLATMTPEKVVGAYVDAFAEVIARAEQSGTKPFKARHELGCT